MQETFTLQTEEIRISQWSNRTVITTLLIDSDTITFDNCAACWNIRCVGAPSRGRYLRVLLLDVTCRYLLQVLNYMYLLILDLNKNLLLITCLVKQSSHWLTASFCSTNLKLNQNTAWPCFSLGWDFFSTMHRHLGHIVRVALSSYPVDSFIHFGKF